MAFFDRLREAIFGKPILRDDPTFGELQYFPNRKYQHCSFWAADTSSIRDAEFGDISKPDELYVYATKDGPSEAQREVFRRFQEHLAEIKMDLQRRMFEDNQQWSELAKVADDGPLVDDPFPLAENESHAYDMGHFAKIEVFADAKMRGCEIGIYVCIPWEIEHNRYVTINNSRVTDYFPE